MYYSGCSVDMYVVLLLYEHTASILSVDLSTNIFFILGAQLKKILRICLLNILSNLFVQWEVFINKSKEDLIYSDFNI